MALSVRDTIEQAYPDMDVSLGVLNELVHPFWKNHREAYPFTDSPGSTTWSLRDTVESLRWPSSYTQASVYPNDQEPEFSENLQGASHSANRWLISQQNRKIWAWPVDRDLMDDFSDAIEGRDYTFPPGSFDPDPDTGYNHFGDIDFWDKWIFVPVEGKDPNVVAVFRFEEAPSGQQFFWHLFEPLPAQTGGASNTPWCAVSPTNAGTNSAYLFSSHFFNDDTTPTGDQVFVHVYAFNPQTMETQDDMQLNHVGDLGLRDAQGSPMEKLRRIQGGCITDNGHLYLVSDMKSINGGGFHGFDLVSGRRRVLKPLQGSTEGDAATFDDEWEGITAWDLDQPAAVAGQLHVAFLFNDVVDNVSIYHFEVPSGEESDV